VSWEQRVRRQTEEDHHPQWQRPTLQRAGPLQRAGRVGVGGLTHTDASGRTVFGACIAGSAGRAERRPAVAIAHTILVIVWHILHGQVAYSDLGADYYDRRDNPGIRKAWLLRQLKNSATTSRSALPPDNQGSRALGRAPSAARP
jgi:hypothetical protein